MTAKLLPVAFLIGICTTACNGPAQEIRAVILADDTIIPPTDTMITNHDTIHTARVASWKKFEQYKGQFAEEVALLDQEPLKSRLNRLLGKNRKTFLERFKVCPPIEVENNVLFNEGHAAAADNPYEAALAIDMDRDIIYAGYSFHKNVVVYAEKKDTSYPEQFKHWINH
ncbi:hypothetical protein [Chitinophaga qingshengii]|uniref:Uncharacterized protein n=1 Tax=Chitinophaga qingshengii TaxID=1569794 RepID=A0ABR7TPR1_9BACT|nr:hypothetical protein [Chitinophaga qingshengii]MBC9931968.1 hypothetical protein [Chitinophaga qingshengii]